MRGLRSTAASLPLRQADLRGMDEGGHRALPAASDAGGPARLSVRSRGSRPGTCTRAQTHLKPAAGSGALQVHNLVRLRMSGVYKHHHDPARGWMFSLVEVNTVELREGQGERHDDGGARSI